MPQPSYSTPHTQKDNSAHDVQHGVVAARSLLWPFYDNQLETIDGKEVPSGVVVSCTSCYYDMVVTPRLC